MEERGSSTCIRPRALWHEIIFIFLKHASTFRQSFSLLSTSKQEKSLSAPACPHCGINLGTFTDAAPNPLPATYPFSPNHDGDFDAGCLARPRLYKARETHQLSQQTGVREGSGTHLSKHWFLAAFFLPGPLRPSDLWKRRSLRELLRNKCWADHRRRASSIPARVPASPVWRLPRSWRLQDLRRLQRG